MFKPQQMPILDLLPPILEQVRAWDLASSAGKGDWTVSLKLARVVGQNYNDMFIVTDIRRIRGAPEEVRKLVKDVAEADGYGVKIWLPRDPAQAGADQAESYIRMLIGYAVEAERMSGDR
jgi:phage terminase large subunit-like protein